MDNNVASLESAVYCVDRIEEDRRVIQKTLDEQRTTAQRNALGQYSTPYPLALAILKHAKTFLPQNSAIDFIDPALGTGVFYGALRQVFDEKQINCAVGYEIDAHYATPARELWSDTQLEVKEEDFTCVKTQEESQKYNLLICNPPYSRHHHLGADKRRLRDKAKESSGMSLSGLAGLYCYFIALSHPIMKEGAIAGWLLPSEFMDVNYGSAIRHYLLTEVTLLHIHRFAPDDLQFDDAIVSSVVVLFKNEKPGLEHRVRFTYGGSLDAPKHDKLVSLSVLTKETKWTRFPLSEQREQGELPKLRDFFTVKRGIATGDNAFFILKKEDILERGLPLSQFRPILPSPRSLLLSEIESSSTGEPLVPTVYYVLDCRLSYDEIAREHPALKHYLEEGMAKGVDQRYLCKARKLWYAQEAREASMLYCTYIGRSDLDEQAPFRFILNHSKAIVSNSFLMLYPKGKLAEQMEKERSLRHRVFEVLNQIDATTLRGEGRVYGGGMYKLEPKELLNVPVPELAELLKNI